MLIRLITLEQMRSVGSSKGLLASFLIVFALVLGCSGGGGDGGNSLRTRDTALRVAHGGIDVTPVALFRVDAQERFFVQSAKYAQATNYVPVEPGETILSLERNNSPDIVVKQFSTTLSDNTEYTLYIFGQVQGVGVQTLLKEDVVEQPDEGFAIVEIFNSYLGTGAVKVSIGSAPFSPIRFGKSGGPVSVASGLTSVLVSDGRGKRLAALEVNIPDRAEVLFHVTGSDELGVSFVPVSFDFD